MEIKGDNSSDDPGDHTEITMDRDEQEMDVDPEQPCPLRSAGLKWEDFFGKPHLRCFPYFCFSRTYGMLRNACDVTYHLVKIHS